jgi:hypothetical protein
MHRALPGVSAAVGTLINTQSCAWSSSGFSAQSRDRVFAVGRTLAFKPACALLDFVQARTGKNMTRG